MRAGAVVGTWAACGSLVACAGFPYVRGARRGDDILVPLTEFVDGGGRLVEAEGLALPLYVRRQGDSFSAVSTRCAHRGCQVEPAGEELECPCHGSRYTLDGDLLGGPATRGLQTFPVRVEGSVVRILLGGGS